MSAFHMSKIHKIQFLIFQAVWIIVVLRMSQKTEDLNQPGGKAKGISKGPDYEWFCETAKKYNIEM